MLSKCKDVNDRMTVVDEDELLEEEELAEDEGAGPAPVIVSCC
jgi:hypothetical protein